MFMCVDTYRLKAISVTNHRAITSTGFKNFLIHQTNLIDVNFAGCSNFNFECFQFLFHQNRNLENIEIDFNNNLTISESLVKSLALSPLKSLRFKIPTEIIYLQPTNSYENDQLLKLDLNLIISESNGNVFLLPMLKPFRNLTSLSIDFSNQRPNNIQDGRQTASYIFENLVMICPRALELKFRSYVYFSLSFLSVLNVILFQTDQLERIEIILLERLDK